MLVQLFIRNGGVPDGQLQPHLHQRCGAEFGDPVQGHPLRAVSAAAEFMGQHPEVTRAR